MSANVNELVSRWKKFADEYRTLAREAANAIQAEKLKLQAETMDNAAKELELHLSSSVNDPLPKLTAAAKEYLLKAPDPMPRKEAISAVALVLCMAEETIERLKAELAQATQSLIEVRNAAAAGARLIAQHGLTDQFVSECEASGVTAGFGVRAQERIDRLRSLAGESKA